MSWPNKNKITDGVLNMLQVNMGWHAGEQLLVITDAPRPEHWELNSPAFLIDMLERAMLARLVTDTAHESQADSPVSLTVYPATGSNGAEPPAEIAEAMRQADVVIALTTYSLSHTDARQAATSAGVRLASMPSFLADMFYPGGPMAVDYRQVAAEAEAFTRWLTQAEEALVRSPGGTNVRFRLAGRKGEADTGLYVKRGQWGNLPAGEAFIPPLEGTAEGVIVVQAGWYPELKADMLLYFQAGQVVEVQGGGRVGDRFRDLLRPGYDDPLYTARRNLAELGIGTNPNAHRPDNVLEAEKIRGTVHLAIGDNSHMGGMVNVDLHEDFVIPEPQLLLDGEPVIGPGANLFPAKRLD
jgi:leucyl aminopeptidase (aminopeptidase T)